MCSRSVHLENDVKKGELRDRKRLVLSRCVVKKRGGEECGKRLQHYFAGVFCCRDGVVVGSVVVINLNKKNERLFEIECISGGQKRK